MGEPNSSAPTEPMGASGGGPAAGPPARLGDFRILRELGRGGMGVVYEAVQGSLGRRVALKVLPRGAERSPDAVERFRREAAAAASLDHEHIVRVYASGEDGGYLYYAMALVEGKPASRLIREERIPPDRAARLALQAARALDYAHGKGVIHRDVKPGNFLVTADDRLLVTDFGLAKLLHGEGASLTRSGAVVGTVSYMSPEQASPGEAELDHRADIYSLGAALYEMLALSPPFTGDNTAQLVKQVLFDEPRDPRKLVAAVPGDLATIALKALEKEPERRYATAGAMAADLRRYLDGEPILARPASPVEKLLKWARRHRGIVRTAAAIALAGLAAAGTLGVQLRRAERARAVEGALGRGGELLDKERKPADARDQARLAIGLDGSEPRAWFLLGAASQRLGDLEGALAAYDRAIQLDPSRAEALIARGELRLESEEAAAAEADAVAALALFAAASGARAPAADATPAQATARALFLLGAARVALGRTADGAADLERSIAAGLSGPPGGRAHLALGRAHLSLGRYEAARDTLRAFQGKLLPEEAADSRKDALLALARAELALEGILIDPLEVPRSSGRPFADGAGPWGALALAQSAAPQDPAVDLEVGAALVWSHPFVQGFQDQRRADGPVSVLRRAARAFWARGERRPAAAALTLLGLLAEETERSLADVERAFRASVEDLEPWLDVTDGFARGLQYSAHIDAGPLAQAESRVPLLDRERWSTDKQQKAVVEALRGAGEPALRRAFAEARSGALSARTYGEAIEADPEGATLARLLRGRLRRRLGERRKAREEFEALLALPRGKPDGENGLGLLLLDEGRADEARSRFEAAAALAPDRPEFRANLALALARGGREAEARDRRREAERLRLAFPGRYCVRALFDASFARWLLDEPGPRLQLAFVLPARALDLDPSDPLAFLERARLCWLLGRFDQALEEADRALEREPDLADAHLLRGEVLSRHLGRPTDALEPLARASASGGPSAARAHYERAVALDALGRRDEALAAIDRAAAADPAWPLPTLRRGLWRGEARGETIPRSPAGAPGAFDRPRARLLVRAAEIRRKAKELDQGVRFAHRAVEEDPTLGEAYYVRSRLTMRRRSLTEYPAALRDIILAAELDPESFEGRLELEVREVVQKGMSIGRPVVLAAVRDAFEAMIAKDRDRAIAEGGLGMFLLLAGDATEALPRLDRAVALEPAISYFWVARGEARGARGEWDAAATDWRTALERQPRLAYPHAGLAAAHAARGEREGAMEQLGQAARKGVPAKAIDEIPAFAPLRGDPGYRKALERAEGDGR